MKTEAFGLYKTKGELSKLLPDFVADNILDVDFAYLKQIGIKHILIDLDLTLRKVGAKELEQDMLTALIKLNHDELFKTISLVTNNIRAKRYADRLGIQAFMPYWERQRPIRKPNIKFFQRVLTALSAEPYQSAMIGDKVHSDVIGANNAGMISVLVNPLGKDYWFDRLLLTRWREHRSLSRARRGIRPKKG